MTPRLAVTQEQATSLFVTGPDTYTLLPITLRFPERPTMPCRYEHVQYGKVWSEAGVTPIPEGARVRIEYPCDVCDGTGRGSLDGKPQDWLTCGECNGKGWHPVALATLTEVHAALADGQPYRWYVTLSDIKPVEADHDEPI